MNTLAVTSPQTRPHYTKAVQDRIFTVFGSIWKAIRKLACITRHTPAYSERLLRDKDLGPEFRRMKW
jgi:hypothetical protein